MAVDPAAGKYGHVGQGVDRDVDMPAVLTCTYHVDIPRLHAEQLCAFTQPLHKVGCIISHAPYRVRLCSLSIGQGQRPVIIVIKVGIHELAEPVGSASHIGSFYSLRGRVKLSPPHPLRFTCTYGVVPGYLSGLSCLHYLFYVRQ